MPFTSARRGGTGPRRWWRPPSHSLCSWSVSSVGSRQSLPPRPRVWSLGPRTPELSAGLCKRHAAGIPTIRRPASIRGAFPQTFRRVVAVAVAREHLGQELDGGSWQRLPDRNHVVFRVSEEGAALPAALTRIIPVHVDDVVHGFEPRKVELFELDASAFEFGDDRIDVIDIQRELSERPVTGTS